MRHLLVAGLACCGAFAGHASAATPMHVYDLSGTLADANGGPALALVGGATLGADGVAFLANQGLSLSGAAFVSASAYSVAIDFRFDSLPTKYSRILNTSSNNGYYQPDDGLYIHQGDGLLHPSVDYYSQGPHYGGPEFTIGADSYHHLLFTRDAMSTSVYLDGASVLELGSHPSSAMGTNLLFFIDDLTEEAPGFVGSICTYDGKVSASDAAAIGGGACSANVDAGAGAVPEPTSWAMIVGGFGAIGAALRRRRMQTTFA